MAKRIDLFVVDGQNDFCASGEEPADWPRAMAGHRRGALFIEGADSEAVAVANMIRRLKDNKPPSGHRITKIHASLDSHHRNDGSHNIAWKGPDGAPPPPFTIVWHDDVKCRRWVPRFSIGIWQGKAVASFDWALKYTEALESGGRSPLCLWPVHCEIQTLGCCVYHPLQIAYDDWCETTNGWIDWIIKGQWPWSEHYSALRADVPDSTRPETLLNVELLQDMQDADVIAWAGRAGSHCLRWTALDAVNYFGKGNNHFVNKCVFFADASAPVPNPPNGPDFAQWRREFLNEMLNRGATVMKTTEFLM